MINCKFENGSQTSLRHITVNTIIVREGKVLLGKRGTYNGKPILESGKWALIGGFLDRDETILDAIRREAKEESGWEIDNLQLLRINDLPDRPKEDRQNVDIIFFADAVKQMPNENEEVKELKWFDLDNLPPSEQIAFDHEEDINLYIKCLKNKESLNLPFLG